MAYQQHNQLQGQPPTQAAYLSYNPGPSLTGQHVQTHASFIERLGFKRSSTMKSEVLINHIKSHVDTSVHKYLRSIDNEAAFNVMVSEFFERHGADYWGPFDREHLAEPDVSKGFLYPRDAYREGSHLVKALRDFFDNKARLCTNHMKRSHGDDSVNVDYTILTGRKADDLKLYQMTKTGRWPTLEKTDQNFNVDNQKTPTSSWNVFDQVETKTRLRPSPMISSQWKRHISEEEDDGLPLNQQLLKKKRKPRVSAPEYPTRSNVTAKIGKDVARSVSTGKPSQARSESEEPLSHHISRMLQTQLQTPSASHAASATPAVLGRAVIDLESSPERGTKDQNGKKNTLVKEEPLFAGYVAKTMLRVTATNRAGKAPITVPFSACQRFDGIFRTLVTELRLDPDTEKKVEEISATYTWSGKRHGIRKGKVLDWQLFIKEIRKGWESKTTKFEDECEIEMVLHVDE